MLSASFPDKKEHITFDTPNVTITHPNKESGVIDRVHTAKQNPWWMPIPRNKGITHWKARSLNKDSVDIFVGVEESESKLLFRDGGYLTSQNIQATEKQPTRDRMT